MALAVLISTSIIQQTNAQSAATVTKIHAEGIYICSIVGEDRRDQDGMDVHQGLVGISALRSTTTSAPGLLK